MRPKLSKWLYNDAFGNIIFEITPEIIDISNLSKKRYDLWMQSYKPFFKCIMSQDTAQNWLYEITHVLKVLEKNLKIHA